jgi:hypothetical protein
MSDESDQSTSGTERKDVPYQTGTIKADDGNEYPRTKQKGTFSGVCDICGEAIYRSYDHSERCLYR